MPTQLSPQRLVKLLEVGRSLQRELRLDVVLDQLLQTARELTGARFAALGILNEQRTQLDQFLTRGIEPDAHRAIGELPRGRGILGVLIDDPRPLRLTDVTSDPRSYGFPANHPPMGSFLGVPILIRDRAWGNLYLTEKEGGVDFDHEDEASVIVLADWAAIAIENARLYEALDARRGELERAVRSFEATAAIAEAVGAETDLDHVLELVVKRARALVGARSVLVLLAEGDELVPTAAAGHAAAGGARLPVGEGLLGTVLRSRELARVDAIAETAEFDAAALGVGGAQAALVVPLVYRTRALGVLVAVDRAGAAEPFGSEDEQVMRAFAASAATAVATAKTVEAERLRHSLESAEAERRRWARELHDETLQGLGALKVLLSSAARSGDPERIAAAQRQAIEQVGQEIDNLRAIIHELRPASLDALGLEPALQALAKRLAATQGLEVDVEVVLDGARPAPELETAVYRVAQETLSNVAKHADATRVVVSIHEVDGMLHLHVADDGTGFDPAAPVTGFGLLGMRERVELAGGTLTVTHPEQGVEITATFPLG